MRDAFIRRLTDLALEDKRIMLLTGDLGFRVFDDFRARLPRQFLNVGVQEQNMTGVATGLALEGKIVFTYSIANFVLLRSLEQFRNGPCYHGLNVNAVCVGAGFNYGPLGISHHATEDASVMRAIPGVTIVCPGDDWEATCAVDAMIQKKGAGYLRLDTRSRTEVGSADEPFVLGKARKFREGHDLTLIACGAILGETLRAADTLAESGVSCRVLHFHTLKPFDAHALLSAAEETGGIITVEEHTILGGLGGLAAECLLEADVRPSFFKRLGLNDTFTSVVGTQQYLREHYGLDVVSIRQNALALLKCRAR